jgi:hypothetical protein
MIEHIDPEMCAQIVLEQQAYIEVHFDGLAVKMTVYPEHQNDAPALVASGYRKKIINEIIEANPEMGKLCSQALVNSEGSAKHIKKKAPISIMVYVSDPQTFKKRYDGEENMEIPLRIVERMQGKSAPQLVNSGDLRVRVEINETGDEKFPDGFAAAYFTLQGILDEEHGDWEKAWFQRIRVDGKIGGLLVGAKQVDTSPDGRDRYGVAFEYAAKVQSMLKCTAMDALRRAKELDLLDNEEAWAQIKPPSLSEYIFQIDRKAKRWSNEAIQLYID